MPKQLLSAFLPSDENGYQHLLRDNYETPFYSPQLAGNKLDLDRLAEALRISVADFTTHARSLASPDELSVYIVKRLMLQYAPSCFGLLFTTSMLHILGHFRFILRVFGVPIAYVVRFGTRFRVTLNMQAKPPCSLCQTSEETGMTPWAATDFNITGPATPFPGLPG